MTDQIAMFDNPPTPKRPRRCAEPADQPLAELIAARPELEKPDELRNGACVGHSRLFFAPHAERPTNRVVRERKALALCAVCTVKAACEAWADRNRETEGIWAGKIRGRGGNTPDELKPRRQTKAQKSRPSCGTQRGAQLHRKEGTPMCAACETAWENMLAGKAASERRKRMQANAELARIREAS